MTFPSFFAVLRLEGVSTSWAWLWIVLLLAGAALLYFTYLGIFQRSERRLTWVLLTLRALGLLLLVLALARPTWTRESEKVEPGHVAVILDNSTSMKLPDASGAPRYDRARAAVERLRQSLAAANRSGRVVVDLFDINGKRLDAVPAEPTVPETNLGRALREVPPQLKNKPLAGVVLISDGMDNTGEPDFAGLEATLPVHALGFARVEAGALDLEVRSPKGLPENALIHNALRIDVPVVKTGKTPTEATVVLARGKEVLATRKVKLGAGEVEELVPLTFTPHEAGSFVFTVRVEGRAAERDLVNNALNFPLRIDAEPIRVLYLEGFLRYEYKYLKGLLEEDPDVVLASRVRLASAETPEGRTLPEVFTDKSLEKIDVVILGDMEGDFLSASEYRALLRWLDGKNHSLLMLGGYRSFGPDGFRKTPLADVLPVEFVRNGPTQSEESFRLQLTEQGEGHPIFTLSNDRVKDTAAWREALPLQGMSLVERAKPAAVTLAVNPKVRRDGKPAVVLAAQRAGGGGQVMVLTVDTTWRWSRLPRLVGQDDTLYSRFWSQVVRYLANRGEREKRPPLAISTISPTYHEGEKVTIEVARRPLPGVDLTRAQLTLDITGPDGKPLPPEKVPPLKNSSADRNHFQADFVPEMGGRYEITASLQGDGKPLSNQVAEFRVVGTDVELSDPGTNPEVLRGLAETTGGHYANVEDAAELAARIHPEERRSTRMLTTEYWNSPWLFGGFLMAVSGEWLLRRRNHLV